MRWLENLEKEGALANPHDMKYARSTYSGLIGLLKWGTIGSLAIGLLVIILLAS